MDRAAPDWMREVFAEMELLAGMRAGDPAALAALMRRHNQRLYRLARGFLRDDMEAEEVVQEG